MRYVLGSYKNGDYSVLLLSDGTKIRISKKKNPKPEKPESIDLKITNRCDMGCPMCHEDSWGKGAHGDIMSQKFIDTLLEGTELAIGGGNPLCHPDLEKFLEKCKERNIICNITVNQKHFVGDYYRLMGYKKEGLIHGVGVSVIVADNETIEKVKEFPDSVIHVINGIISKENLEKLYDKDFRLLVLGYKMIRRGVDAYSPVVEERMQWLYDNLPQITEHFRIVSFDNLAIRQFNLRRLMSNEEWNEFYMGDDGQFTMYVDAVNKEFASSSVSKNRFPVEDDIAAMFRVVRKEAYAAAV